MLMVMDDEPLLLERGPLLNFWPAEILLPHPHRTGQPLVAYRGVEWRFQAMKSTCYSGPGNSAAKHDMIASARDALQAKRIAGVLPINVELWDRIAFGVMLEALTAKFETHDDLRKVLFDTGSHELVEHQPDAIWGDRLGMGGLNLQGWALMMVRARLRAMS